MSTDQISHTGTQNYTIAIVGGGAAGVSLFAQYVDRCMANGMTRVSIVVYEKSGDVGPGLAYGTSLPCNVLNMRSETMSILPDAPGHFVQWMRDHANAYDRQFPDLDKSFPPRMIYGQYLRDTFAHYRSKATRAGMTVDVVHAFVSDVREESDGVTLALENGERHRADSVVLAVGNFPSSLYQEFCDVEGFATSPWPDSKLAKLIPKHEDVCVLGSRLSAVDAALTLVHGGHTGTITFVSRSGRLPKVQNAVCKPYCKNVPEKLANQLEQNPENAFRVIVQTLRREIKSFYEELPSLKSILAVPEDPMRTLGRDIADAESGRATWQSVICATAPYIERYWQACSAEEKEAFFSKYKSVWISYRHAIPLLNAKKIHRLLQTGQLRIAKGRTAMRYESGTGEFVLDVDECDGRQIRSRYVVNATGDECNVETITSPLISNLLSSGTLVPHTFGGVCVDFDSLRVINREGVVSNRVFTIGSLTYGTHLYTHAIDRNVEHAKRICSSVFPTTVSVPQMVQPPRKSNIAFFMGSDVMSHFMLNRLIPKLLHEGHTPYVFTTGDSVNAKPQPFPLRELAFFERELLHKHVAPFIERFPVQPGVPCLTRGQLKSYYGIEVHDVRSINSAETIDLLREKRVNLGFSLRCYQKFGKKIIQYFDTVEERHLLNLHPGILPMYRGVITTIRAMNNHEKYFGYSLHYIDEQYDAGELVAIRTHPIDYRKSMLLFMNDVYPIGVSMVLSFIASITRGRQPHAVKQNKEESAYYGFPTEAELMAYRRKGLLCVEQEPMIELLVRNFSNPGSMQEYALRHIIEQSVRQWYGHTLPSAPLSVRPPVSTSSIFTPLRS